MSNNQLLNEYMDYRCGMYYWLKNLYISEPTVEVLSEIALTCKKYDVDENVPTFEKEFIEFFSKLEKEEIEELWEEIKAEYARLFIGPKKVPASPYESVYNSHNKQIFGDSCIKVREAYEDIGLKVDKIGKIPDDFIGYELEFMYYLTFLTIEAIKIDDINRVNILLGHQYRFLNDHLIKWIDKFTEAIFNNTKMEYFKILAKFTNEFVKEDCNFIENIK